MRYRLASFESGGLPLDADRSASIAAVYDLSPLECCEQLR